MQAFNQPLSTVDLKQGTYANTGFTQWGASGLAVAWAEENTRESIFNAFRRKETFATTGTRIAVRFFGGYDLSSIDLNSDANALDDDSPTSLMPNAYINLLNVIFFDACIDER